MFLKSISLTNILSFGDKTTTIDLKPLNILIGHNGSGKSNLIECIGLLQAAPDNIAKAFREGGGISDWLWKGAPKIPEAMIEAVIGYPLGQKDLRHKMVFTATNYRFEMLDERIEDESPKPGHDLPLFYFCYQREHPLALVNDEPRLLKKEDISPELSIISQLKSLALFPQITWLGEALKSIRIYRDWSIGRYAPIRQAQKPDMPIDFLEESLSNLGLVLNNLRLVPEARKKLLNSLRDIYPGVEDFDVSIQANTVQVVIHEEHFSIPASRLSDGTLRFLCLLAILCHPNPPPLICIEEPELGLHPDMIHIIADLLRDASTRTQLIVTTHSDLLVEEFSDEPECVLTFEKQGDQTEVHRLDAEELSHWLEKYSLGQLRRKGHIAGNRW